MPRQMRICFILLLVYPSLSVFNSIIVLVLLLLVSVAHGYFVFDFTAVSDWFKSGNHLISLFMCCFDKLEWQWLMLFINYELI